MEPTKDTSADPQIPQLSKLHTSCHDCIFASWFKPVEVVNANGIFQTACYMGRLNTSSTPTTYINPDIELIEAENDTHEFYIINNVKCHYKRTKEWGNKVKADKWKKRVGEENRIKYQAIIPLCDTLEQFKSTVQTFLDQSIPPQQITAIRYENTVSAVDMKQYLDSVGLPWKIHNVLNPDLSDLDAINSIVNSRPYPYYTVANPNTKMPINFFETINNHIYDKHLTFAILQGNSRMPPVTSTAIHISCGGHHPTSLADKLRENECENLIIPVQTLFPQNPA